MSKAEQAVANVLKSLNIEYQTEVKLAGLTNELGTSLPVDFVINVDDKLAMIEYNGQQHYRSVMGDVASLNCSVRNDVARVEYAAKTGIPLLVIHFTSLLKIEKIIKEFINHVKSGCKKKQEYSGSTYGHFSPVLSACAPKLEDVFVSTSSLVEPVSNNPLDLVINKEFGFVRVGSKSAGAIVWTIEQMNKFTLDLKREQKLAASIKIENQNLIAKLSLSNSQLLELNKNNTQLQVQVGWLEDEHLKLELEILALKQKLEEKEKMIKKILPFPTNIRKSNQQFTTEFKNYINEIQHKHRFGAEELREHLALFNVTISDASLRKMVA